MIGFGEPMLLTIVLVKKTTPYAEWLLERDSS